MVEIVHTDILNACNQDDENIPGFATEILMILACDVEDGGVPALPAVPLSNTQRTTIVDGFDLKKNKEFFKVEGELKMSNMTPELVGGKGSRLYKNTFLFTLSGTNVDKEAFGRMVKNADYYVIPKGLDGVRRLMGTPEFPAEIELNEASLGQDPDDDTGVFASYNVIAYSVTPFPPRFTGIANTSPSGSVSVT